ncbi:unnamed protein product [Arabidopsis halleri]
MHQNAGAAPNAGGCFLLMIHKKGGRIRTYGRPDPDLLGWVACFALVASVPETDALRYPALYASPNATLRRALWEQLSSLASMISDPWLIGGGTFIPFCVVQRAGVAQLVVIGRVV